MKNFKVSKKLLLSFGIVLGLLLVSTLVSVLSIQSMSSKLKNFTNVSFPHIQSISNISEALQTEAKNMLYSCVAQDATEINNRLNLVRTGLSDISAEVAELEKSYKGDKTPLTSISSTLKNVESQFSEFSTLCQANQTDAAYSYYSEKIMPSLVSILESVNTVEKALSDAAAQDNKSGQMTSLIGTIVTVVIGLVSILIGLTLAGKITRQLVSGINELKNCAQNMAQGNFDAAITYDAQDEVGELADALRSFIALSGTIIQDIDYMLGRMAAGDFTVTSRAENSYVGAFVSLQQSIFKLKSDLSDVLVQINASADQVADGSEQMSYSAQSLSQGATQQASSVEELSATITTVSDHVNETAQNAASAKEQTDMTGGEITACHDQMDEMIAAMSEISDKSVQIGKIIKTIEDIAFQTNILALNAAVEAARAGEAGKGFAVVADEVRNLATKSQEASQNTSTLIEDTVQAVEKGQDIVNNTASSLQKVVDNSETVINLVDKIATAADEQATSLSQISEGIDQISSVVQTNSSTAEETAAACEELSSQSQVLKDLVSQFTLPNTKPSRQPTIVLSDSPSRAEISSNPIYAMDKY